MWIAGVKSRLYYQAWQCGGTAYAEDLKPSGAIHVGSTPTTATKSVMKKKTNPTRNGFAIAAKKRKAGEIRSKKDKRKNGKNKQAQYLSEAHD